MLIDNERLYNFWAFTDELRKTNIYQKLCWSGPIKKKTILIFAMLQYKQRKTPGDTIILHLCTNNLDVIYSSWDTERDRLKLISLGQFYLFYPLKPKKSKFWKNEELAGDIIMLHMCAKNHNYMMYGSWNTGRSGQIFLSFWTICCSFTHLTTSKVKIFKK